MGSASMDLVTIAGMDTTQWVQECINLQNRTNQLEVTTKQAGASIKSNFGGSIQGAAFAVQDFSSVLSMGGKNALGRALMSTMNNVQMLGAAFGPWGMAITAVGGALGAVLLPKLLEGKGAFDDLTEAAEKSTKAFELMGRRASDMVSFRAKLAGIDTPTERASAINSLELERKKSAAELDVMGKLIASLRADLANAEAAKKAAEGPSGKKFGVDPLMNMFGMATDRAAAMFVAHEAEARITRIKELIASEEARARAAGAEFGGILEKEAALRAKLDGTGGADDFAAAEKRKRDAEKLEKDREDSKRIAEASRSPFDIAMDKVTDIGRLAMGGTLNPDVGARALDKVFSDFSKSTGGKSQANNAITLGSAEGFSALQASLRQGNEKSNDQVALLREVVGLLKQEIAAIGKISGPAPTVGIGGSL